MSIVENKFVLSIKSVSAVEKIPLVLSIVRVYQSVYRITRFLPYRLTLSALSLKPQLHSYSLKPRLCFSCGFLLGPRCGQILFVLVFLWFVCLDCGLCVWFVFFFVVCLFLWFVWFVLWFVCSFCGLSVCFCGLCVCFLFFSFIVYWITRILTNCGGGFDLRLNIFFFSCEHSQKMVLLLIGNSVPFE